MDFNQLDPTNYQAQLKQKAERLLSLFSSFAHPEIEVFQSAMTHYRMRAEFRVWHEGSDLYFYMFDNVKKEKIRTDQFLPAGQLINLVMLDLIAEIKSIEVLRHKLFQVDFLSTTSGEILVTMIYHRKLNDEWITAANRLKSKLSTKFKVDLIGRARKQQFLLDRDFVIEELKVAGRNYKYKQVENSFTQPNTGVATKMLEWAIENTKESKGDLLELYCGNGNFSIVLAQNFNRVLATELAKPSVEAAQFNIADNNITNLQIIRMSAEDFSDAMKGGREYNRLKGIDLQSYQCETILVDPPRAGLDELTLKLVSQYKKILYISCNPNTLVDNLNLLTQTHNITRLALFDQFPYTDHMEAGVVLERI